MPETALQRMDDKSVKSVIAALDKIVAKEKMTMTESYSFIQLVSVVFCEEADRRGLSVPPADIGRLLRRPDPPPL